jgi:hypothetical protein
LHGFVEIYKLALVMALGIFFALVVGRIAHRDRTEMPQVEEILKLLITPYLVCGVEGAVIFLKELGAFALRKSPEDLIRVVPASSPVDRLGCHGFPPEEAPTVSKPVSPRYQAGKASHTSSAEETLRLA